MDALQTALKQALPLRDVQHVLRSADCAIFVPMKHATGGGLMVVYMPADVSNMEAANCHDGLYFVLMGQINTALGMDVSAIALTAGATAGRRCRRNHYCTAFTAEAMRRRMSCPSFLKPALQSQQAVAGHSLGRRIGICRCGNAGAGGVRTPPD